MPVKPIKVFWSELTNTFYATSHYKEKDSYVLITGKKYDVTQDIAAAIDKFEISFKVKE